MRRPHKRPLRGKHFAASAQRRNSSGSRPRSVLRRENFCDERVEPRIAAKRIEKRINFDEGEIVSVAIVVSLFQTIYGLIFLTEAEMDHRENVWRYIALLRHFAQS